MVYRTPEDTSQDYHIEGLPFGTRGGMLVKHVFPSDGEYTMTVTPIFGDNMSPTGFGSVPCEKLEILLDGERLQLLDWQGGRRFGSVRGQLRRPGQSARRSAARPRRGAPAARPEDERGGTLAARNEIPKMRVRFKTTAGHAPGRRHVPRRRISRRCWTSIEHFMRDTLQTGPTPGFTFFPHVGTHPHRRTVQCRRRRRTRRAAARIFVCRPTGAADEARLRAEDRDRASRRARSAVRRPRPTCSR